LRPGGVLVLDNAERHYYQPGISYMADWDRIETMQRYPDKYGFNQAGWLSVAYIKPRE
jgi:hypothetical protein